jgi:chromosome segregation ATPase
MNSSLGGSQSKGTNGVALEKNLKTLEDMLSRGDPYQPNISSDDFFREITTENTELKVKTNELLQQIENMRSKMTEMKAQPIRLENSPDQSARIIRLESDKKRLMIQLSQKSEELEVFRLQMQDKPAGDNIRLQIEAIRKEITAQLQAQNEMEKQRLENKIDDREKKINELNLVLESKEKENDLLEQTIQSLEQRTLDEAENMRQVLVQSMWEQYERKLLARKAEYDQKYQNYMEEQENLGKAIKEWKNKYMELQEKHSALHSQINNSKEDDLVWKKAINNYENTLGNMSLSLERAQQLNSELEMQVETLKSKVYMMDKSLTEAEIKENNSEDRILDLQSKVKAYQKELDRAKGEANTWKDQLEKAEVTNSKFKLNLMELENQIKNNDKFKSSNTRELLWEKTNSERLSLEVQQMETELRTAIAARDAFKDQLEKTREEILIKNNLLEEYKKTGKVEDATKSEILKQWTHVKGELAKAQEECKVLATQLSKVTSERNDLQFRIEADRIKNTRPEKSALSMLNRSRETAHVEVRILEEKLQESQVEITELKAKLGQLVKEWKPKIFEVAKENEKLLNDVQTLTIALEAARGELMRQSPQPQTAFGQPATLTLKSQGQKQTEAAQSGSHGTATFGGKAETNSTQEELSKLNIEYINLKMLFEKISHDNKTLLDQKRSLEADNRSLSKTLDEHNQNNKKVGQDLQAALDSKETLKRNLQALEEEHAKCGQKTTEEKCNCTRLKNENMELYTQLGHLKQQVKDLEVKNSDLVRDHRGLNDQVAKLERQAWAGTDLQNTIKQREDEIRGCHGTIDSLAIENENLNRLIAQKNEKIRQLESFGPTQGPSGGSQKQPQGTSSGPFDEVKQERGGEADTFGVNEAAMALSYQIEQLQEANQDLLSQIAIKDSTIRELEQNMARTHGEIGQQNSQLMREVEDIQYVNAVSERMRVECDNLRVDVRKLLDERAYILNENNVLHQDNIALATRVDELTKQKPGQLQLRPTQEATSAKELQLRQQVADLTDANNRLMSTNLELETRVGPSYVAG